MESINIWVYKRNDSGTSYATKECNLKQNDHNWIKEFSIQHNEEFSFIKLFAIRRTNEVLLFKDYLLFRYDPKSSILNCLWNHNVRDANYIESTTLVQGLVSLKDLGETDVTYLKDLDRLRASTVMESTKCQIADQMLKKIGILH